MPKDTTNSSCLAGYSRRRKLGAFGVVALVVAGLSVMIALLVGRDDNDKRVTTTAQQGDDSVSGDPSPVPSSSSGTPLEPSTLLPTTLDLTLHPSNLPTAEPTGSPTLPPTTSTPTLLPTDTSSTFSPPGEVVFGTAGGIPYVHCEPAASLVDVILLHGASFTKEVWLNERHMLFANFCKDTSVTALDLPVSSGNAPLRAVLDALVQERVISSSSSETTTTTRPVVLVTPSASGRTMVDWMMNGNLQLLPQYVKTWVPVASGSIRDASDSQIASISGLVQVLAIYGDRDSKAGLYQQRLVDLVEGAVLVELEGGHAVYNWSPDEFVQNILEFEGIRTP